jgi:hypothetical protein
MAKAGFITTWLKENKPAGAPGNLVLLTERAKQRPIVEEAVRSTVVDHLVGAKIVEQIGGMKKAAAVIRNAFPTSKRARSGDIGEIIATEYVDQATAYTVPVRRLRFKDDRGMAMRGDDVLAFEFGAAPLKILKTESKSRVALGAATAKEACDGLCRHDGRPNPSTLSFLSRRLREQGSHDLASALEKLQESDIPLGSISHLIFTLSANSPVKALSSVATSPIDGIMRQLVGCVIEDHAAFIQKVFDALMK